MMPTSLTDVGQRRCTPHTLHFCTHISAVGTGVFGTDSNYSQGFRPNQIWAKKEYQVIFDLLTKRDYLS